MPTLSSISRLHNVIESNLFMTTGNLDYDRVTDAIILLANAAHDYNSPEPNEPWDLYAIGEFACADINDLIVGAYWHYTEWHGGQWSKEYAALSALGQYFSPGMTTGPEPDSRERDVYLALHDMAASELSAQLQA